MTSNEHLLLAVPKIYKVDLMYRDEDEGDGQDQAPTPPQEIRRVSAAHSELVTSAAEYVRRCEETLNAGLRYQFGAGNVLHASVPLHRGTRLDCSEWAMHRLGIDKMTREPLIIHFNGGWFSSGALVYDATHTGGIFTRTDYARPGYLMAVGQQGAVKGHVVVVRKASNGRATEVIECSSYHDRLRQDAIGVRPAEFMYRRGAIVIKPDWF